MIDFTPLVLQGPVVAGRPVLVVNQEFTRPYQHVLLTADLSRMSAGIADVTKQLGLLERSRAFVVHALEDARPAMLYMAGVNKSEVGKYQQVLRQVALNEIEAQFSSAGLNSAHFRVLPPQISPIRAIEQVAKRTDSDLVVVGSSRFPAFKRLFPGSVSNEVLRRAKHDVLLVSPAAARRARHRASAITMHQLKVTTPQRTPELH